MIPQEGQIGLPIIYEVQDANGAPRNISAFTTLELVFEKPNKTSLVKTVEFNTNGLDGLLKMVTEAGDLVPYGSFQVQAHLADLTHDEMTEVSVFPVARNLNIPVMIV